MRRPHFIHIRAASVLWLRLGRYGESAGVGRGTAPRLVSRPVFGRRELQTCACNLRANAASGLTRLPFAARSGAAPTRLRRPLRMRRVRAHLRRRLAAAGSRRGSGLNRTRLFKPRPARRRPGPHPRPGRPAPPERVPCRGVRVVTNSHERNLLASAVREPPHVAERVTGAACFAAPAAHDAENASGHVSNRRWDGRTTSDMRHSSRATSTPRQADQGAGRMLRHATIL